MIIRSRAPLRLGLAGGGTDVGPYTDQYGGAILNATINKFAYATLIPLSLPQIVIKCHDINEHHIFNNVEEFDLTDSKLALIKGIHNRVKREFNIKQPLFYQLETYVDAPPGSGLGSSSTLVVTILAAFAEWLDLPLGDYDLAHLAYIYELEFSLIQYYTGTSRLSSKIIDAQVKNVSENAVKSIEAMHSLKQLAYDMKESLLRGRLNDIGNLLNDSWVSKKETAEEVSNPIVDEIYNAAIHNGALGGKISGAGGGGYMMFYVKNGYLYHLINVLNKFDGQVERINFSEKGVLTWRT